MATCTNGWMNGWQHARMDRWMDGDMHECMDGSCIDE